MERYTESVDVARRSRTNSVRRLLSVTAPAYVWTWRYPRSSNASHAPRLAVTRPRTACNAWSCVRSPPRSLDPVFQFFIVHDDPIGRAVKEKLIERARAGVRVAFLYDEVASHDLRRSYNNELS